MAPPALQDVESLRRFRFQSVLNEDPMSHSITLLGAFPVDDTPSGEQSPAIVRIEKTALLSSSAESLCESLNNVQMIEHTDIYSWFSGWLKPLRDRPDVKINIICPATQVHIRKYTRQQIIMVHETPELYERIVKPYITAFPPSRIQWVYDILAGKSEVEKILHRDSDPEHGYVILPDMKWDLTTISSLYLVAIALSTEIRCLRDIKKRHIGMLRNIEKEATRIIKEKWGLEEGTTRFYIHYQPSYYHFHIHIVNANYTGLLGGTVGQAHLLDDIISLLEIGSDDGPSILERMTLTYGLGEQHGLYEQMKAQQVL